MLLSHIHSNTKVFDDIAGSVENRMTFERMYLIAHLENDSEIHVEVGTFVRPFDKNFSAHPVSIFWMHALVKCFVDGIPLRIEAEHTVMFLCQ